MYQAAEAFKMPVGLYSNKGPLYALFRQPEENSVTCWKMIKLLPDIDNGTVLQMDVVRLPAQRAACHLYVLPSETSWLALELGSMPAGIMKHG